MTVRDVETDRETITTRLADAYDNNKAFILATETEKNKFSVWTSKKDEGLMTMVKCIIDMLLRYCDASDAKMFAEGLQEAIRDGVLTDDDSDV